ncbi:hypothetical protein KC887_03330 [Candidatus Kaiserbacteria bacterium]|nr:hypothetical protein [Candidatus Kaiserbacteria bacterium]
MTVYNYYFLLFIGFVATLFLLPAAAFASYDGEVGGWVPWWIDDAAVKAETKNVSELTVLYPFIYEVEGGGDIVAKADIKSGVWKDLIRTADRARVDVIPTIAWFDGEAIHATLSDRKQRRALVHDIADLVDENNFDGINIDFEQKWSETIDYYSMFLRELDDALGRDSLTCTVEARMDPDHRWRNVPSTIEYANDYKAINRYCDWVEIMAYDQQRADLVMNDERKGLPYNPVADNEWVEHVLDVATRDIDEDKIILGIPTYGRAYDVTVASEWYKDYKSVASVNHNRAVELSEKYDVPIGRTAGGEAIITYFPEDSVWKIFNQLPTPAGTPEGYEAAAKALLVATIADIELPVRMLTWGDATAAEDKMRIADDYNLKGVAFFSFNSEEDKRIWKLW